MKVLVLPSWYPTVDYPNNGSFFKEQTKALQDSGVNVEILVIDIPYRGTKNRFKYFKENVYIEDGIKIHRYVFPVGILHRFHRLYYLFLKIVALRIYRKKFSENKIDILMAHSFFIGGFVANTIGKYSGIKNITVEHSSKILLNKLNKVEKRILSEVVNSSDKFVCVSNNLKEKVESTIGKLKKDNVLVNPNMVRNIFYIGDKTKEAFIFSSVGNLIPLKNMDKLIKGFILSFEQDDKVLLNIVGDGPERKKLEHIIVENNREHQIKLLGSLSRRSVADVLSKSHAMALISKIETFGISYVEALMSGNIIIASKNGGSDDIVNNSNGIFVDKNSIPSIADGLRSIYKNYDNYNIEEIRNNANKKYSEATFSGYYKSLFQSLISG